jgi:NAD(P)-dependent dehydrogenase (short-subunit alcohol dehydrogenase family)
MTQVKWTADATPDQTGRTVLITGANSGLGPRSAERWRPMERGY